MDALSLNIHLIKAWDTALGDHIFVFLDSEPMSPFGSVLGSRGILLEVGSEILQK